MNSERLPAYLFARSQQVDRLSRRDMFVVSLAPSRDEPNWPPLFDFRAVGDTSLSTLSEIESVALVISIGTSEIVESRA